ncbi:MAG: NAD(P) transhydrogenase subunit alpha [Pseudomonadota bacterium]
MTLEQIAQRLEILSAEVANLAVENGATIQDVSSGTFIGYITAFVLACFVGYYVVWSVTPALHSPLMGVTNAISSVIIVGALIAAGPGDASISTYFGFFAVFLASINIFGGFMVTHRMLQMFKKKTGSKE